MNRRLGVLVEDIRLMPVPRVFGIKGVKLNYIQWLFSYLFIFDSPRYAWLYPPNNQVVGGYIGFTPSVCPSVRPSVRLSRLRCPLSNIYSSGWILSILATNDHYYERVCRTQWPLTLTYIFKVIRPWLKNHVRSVASTVLDGFFLYLT